MHEVLDIVRALAERLEAILAMDPEEICRKSARAESAVPVHRQLLSKPDGRGLAPTLEGRRDRAVLRRHRDSRAQCQRCEDHGRRRYPFMGPHSCRRIPNAREFDPLPGSSSRVSIRLPSTISCSRPDKPISGDSLKRSGNTQIKSLCRGALVVARADGGRRTAASDL